MLILTNIFRINGAGVICYDGLLKIIADMAGENHIIIPCSIHETIVMSEKTWLMNRCYRKWFIVSIGKKFQQMKFCRIIRFGMRKK